MIVRVIVTTKCHLFVFMTFSFLCFQEQQREGLNEVPEFCV